MKIPGTNDYKTQEELLSEELAILDQAMVEVNGNLMKPSQCFHIEMDPPHVLYNENCPGSLKEKIGDLLKRYTL